MKPYPWSAVRLVFLVCMALLARGTRADELVADDDSSGPSIPLIFIHGWTNDRSRWDGPVKWLRSPAARGALRGYQVYRYEYDWSQSIEGSGVGLAREIERVLKPGSRFVIVAHSMGGLVARSAIENYTGHTPSLEARLLKLITIATPHHGSPSSNIAWLQNDSKIERLDFGQGLIARFTNLNNSGGYGLGWDNSDGQMPQAVWDGQSGLKLNKIPRASRFTEQLNARANMDDASRRRLAQKYVAIGAYQSYVPDLSPTSLVFLVKDNHDKADLANRVILGRYLQNSDDADRKWFERVKARWVDNYVANDDVVPLQSALFLDDGARIGSLEGENVSLDLASLEAVHGRAGLIKVVRDTGHSKLPDDPEVLSFIAQTLRATSSATAGAAPAPPNEERIAFVSNRDGNNEIYIMNADGSGQSRLTRQPGSDWQPTFSPDGSRIAFASERNGKYDIWIMGADGSNPHRLTQNAASDSAPAWSPDGATIAFVSERDGRPQIYVMDADGSSQRRLVANRYQDGAPCFSPDGRHLAFESYRDGDYDIWMVNADGSNPRRLSHSSTLDWRAAWSPAGNQIAFAARDTTHNVADDIYTADVQSGARRRWTTDAAGEWDPAWSRDGTRIAYAKSVGVQLEIYVMGAGGSAQTRITHDAANDFQPAWSGGRVPSSGASHGTASEVSRMFAGQWRGDWAGDDGARFSFQMQLEYRDGKCEGVIGWTKHAPVGAGSNGWGVGQTGHEYVSGTFNEIDRQLVLRGVRVDAPLLIGLDEYRLNISKTDWSLRGITRNITGRWRSVMSGRHSVR